ncbi:MAG: malate dehydrogenase [Acidobacteriota bacterium]
MSTVVILGAGEIGGALARQLAATDLVSRIVLVDDLGSVAAGKALDVAQSGPVDRYHTLLTGTNDLAAVVGATVLVVADRAGQPGGEWQDEAGLAMLKRVAGLNQVAPLLCAGAAQGGLIERGVNEAGIPRVRLFGTAGEALRSAVTAITALEAQASPADVSLTVLGRPPQQVIVPWDQGAIGGRSIPQVLSAAQLARLDARAARLWPPGPYALASAAARIIRTALTRGPRLHMAMVAVTRDEGTPGRAAIMPVLLQPAGIKSIVTPTLSSRDQVRYESSLR